MSSLHQQGTRSAAAAAISLVLPLAALAAAGPAAPNAELSASATTAELTIGATLTVNGTLSVESRGVPGAPLVLQSEPYPSHGFAAVATASTGPDGSFSFAGIRANRNLRLRVATAGAPPAMSRELPVYVDPAVALDATPLGRGKTRLSVRVRHTLEGGAQPVRAWWFAAPRGTSRLRLVAVTSTRELAPGLTRASAIINPPAKRFAWRVCMNPAWEPAMGRSRTHGQCPRGDFKPSRGQALQDRGEGRGAPAAPYPSPGAIAAAARFLEARAGRTAFAVVDSSGRLAGVRVREHFQTASVIKVMMLVAYLQMLQARHRGLTGADTALLYPMIHISDNDAASAVLGVVGSAAIARVARESGMSDYAPGVGWWAFTQTSAADQARFMLGLDRLIPPRFYAYARGLLSGIEPSQSWGIPPVARPRWQVFFKTGQIPSEGLYNEVARLERPGVTFTIAVFTSGDPSMSYGRQTIGGLAARLLARSP
jgi:Beta-lactamase enzyme family